MKPIVSDVQEPGWWSYYMFAVQYGLLKVSGWTYYPTKQRIYPPRNVNIEFSSELHTQVLAAIEQHIEALAPVAVPAPVKPQQRLGMRAWGRK